MNRRSVAKREGRRPTAQPVDLASLDALRVDHCGEIIAALVGAMRERIPDFGTRRMTYSDFLAVAGRDGLTVELTDRPTYCSAGELRRLPPRILVEAGLLEPYLVFAAFHALAHWIGHPRELRDYHEARLGQLVEHEADTIAYLALVPHPAGPPYPALDTCDHYAGNALHCVARHPAKGGTWETRELTLQRSVKGLRGELASKWTDEDVLRLVRSELLRHDVAAGRRRIGGRWRELRDHQEAFTEFVELVERGADEAQRSGRRAIVKCQAYNLAAAGGGR